MTKIEYKAPSLNLNLIKLEESVAANSTTFRVGGSNDQLDNPFITEWESEPRESQDLIFE